jgi:hypothetical protein
MRWPRPARLVEPWKKIIGLYSDTDKKNNHAPGKEQVVIELALKIKLHGKVSWSTHSQ